jgi:polysaccharide biosynthesis/export protein
MSPTLIRLALLVLLLIPLAGSAQSLPPLPTPGDFVLVPGDVMQVRIWREPDLSGDFVVDENGSVVFPLLGERRVAGVPVDELRNSLLEAYSAELRNPSITITPLRRVFVLGEVNVPGLKVVDPTVSLAGVVALAGGANPLGDLRKIRLVRDGVVILDEIPAASALAEMDIRSGDQVIVGRRGWFDRNSTFVVSAVLSVTSILISLVR